MNSTGALEKVFRFFGNDANPTLIAAGIAIAKGIFRPIFTMMDNKQDPQVKKYAAIRECLTEVIAICVYTIGGLLAKTASKSLTRIKENLPKKDFSKNIFNKIIKEEKVATNIISAEKAASVAKTFFKFKSSVNMLGVFLNAFIVIPLVCSIAMKPIMNAINKKKQTTQNPLLLQNANIRKPLTFQQNTQRLNNVVYNTQPVKFQGGLKVGGL